ncbi:MAG: cupin domain-containing protein, partial [Alphaproteobacteria bacterium]
MAKTPTAEEVIAHLALKPHPEGGWFRETFRDQAGPEGRGYSTSILFLLKAGEVSHWHRIDA